MGPFPLFSLRRAVIIAALLPCAALAGVPPPEKVDFNRDVRPIILGKLF